MTTHKSSCQPCGANSGERATAQEAQKAADTHNRLYHAGQKVAK